MIDQLTADQEALLPWWYDEWLRIAICTEPIDRPRAEAAIGAMYAMVGSPPREFRWCDSRAAARHVRPHGDFQRLWRLFMAQEETMRMRRPVDGVDPALSRRLDRALRPLGALTREMEWT